MKTREFVQIFFGLLIFSTSLVASVEDSQNADHGDISARATRSFAKGSVGLSGILQILPDEDGIPRFTLITQSGERFIVDYGTNPELESRLKDLVTDDKRLESKARVVDLMGELGQKGNTRALKRASIEFPEGDEEQAAASRFFRGTYNITLKRPGIFADDLAKFVNHLRESIPDVNIGMTVDNGQPYSGRRYVLVQVSSDYSRSYLKKLISENRDLSSLVEVVEKTPTRTPSR